MADNPVCPAQFHEYGGGVPYEDVTDGKWTAGYQCPDCGERDQLMSTYEPGVKPCPDCGQEFEGMADVPTELCVDCVMRNMRAYLQSLTD